jgi:hypothetical protein
MQSPIPPLAANPWPGWPVVPRMPRLRNRADGSLQGRTLHRDRLIRRAILESLLVGVGVVLVVVAQRKHGPSSSARASSSVLHQSSGVAHGGDRLFQKRCWSPWVYASPPIGLVTGGGHALVGLSAVEQDEVWQRWRRGESLRLIARRLGKRGPSVRAFVLPSGGVQCPLPRRAAQALLLAEREEISRGLAAGHSCRVIASVWDGRRQRSRGRWPAMVAVAATGRSPLMGRRPAGAAAKPAKLALEPRLRRWWRTNWRCGGRRSRSPGGCRWPTLPIR